MILLSDSNSTRHCNLPDVHQLARVHISKERANAGSADRLAPQSGDCSSGWEGHGFHPFGAQPSQKGNASTGNQTKAL